MRRCRRSPIQATPAQRSIIGGTNGDTPTSVTRSTSSPPEFALRMQSKTKAKASPSGRKSLVSHIEDGFQEQVRSCGQQTLGRLSRPPDEENNATHQLFRCPAEGHR